MTLKNVRAKLNAINKTVEEHVDFLLEIRQDEQLYKDDVDEIGKMADTVLTTLHNDEKFDLNGAEKDWVCEKCGKSTFETDYEYLVHPTLHLGCALTEDEQMENFAQELQKTDTGHQPC